MAPQCGPCAANTTRSCPCPKSSHEYRYTPTTVADPETKYHRLISVSLRWGYVDLNNVGNVAMKAKKIAYWTALKRMRTSMSKYVKCKGFFKDGHGARLDTMFCRLRTTSGMKGGYISGGRMLPSPTNFCDVSRRNLQCTLVNGNAYIRNPRTSKVRNQEQAAKK